MNILNTHNHRLVFCLDGDAPEKYIERWNKFKLICESGSLNNRDIVERMKGFSKLETNKNLQSLDRLEGGLGGGNNSIHKQIRFRFIYKGQLLNGTNIPYYKKDDNIIFNEIISTDTEKWSYTELDDLIYSFVKTANYNVGADCVNGYIEMVNKKTFSDNYLDSDTE